MIELIQAIKAANTFHGLKVKPSRDEIHKALTCSIEELFAGKELHSLLEPYMDPDFIGHWLPNLQSSYLSNPNPTSLPIGNVALYCQGPFGFLAALELMVPLLSHQNAVFLFLESPSEVEKGLWARLGSKLPNPTQLQILEFSTDSWQFALKHPGVRAVYWNDPHHASWPLPEDLSSTLLRKYFYRYSGGKNTFCVLDGANLNQAAQDLTERIAQGQGFAPFSVSRILVQQKIEAEFLETFKAHLHSLPVTKNSNLSISLTPKENLPIYSLAELTQDQGRVLIEVQGLTVLTNISNCSEWHQIPLNQATAFWMDLKYPFEIAKWVNNIPHHLQVTIWMDSGKSKDWLDEIQSHRIQINTPLKNEKPHSFWTGVNLMTYQTRYINGA